MHKFGKLFLIVGFVLIFGGLALFLTVRFSTAHAQTVNAAVVETIRGLLPPSQPGVTDQYSDMSMPALEIDGKDYSALLEISALGVTLPVADVWNKWDVESQPCRFDGTVYDSTLVIGGADRAGQFADFDLLDLGDTITVTDMTGAVFTYVIDSIDRSSSVSAEVLTDETAHLTLFVRSAFALDYILLRCVMRK